jgi:hypothetical protein
MSLENIKEIAHPQHLENVKAGELIVVEDENKVRKSGFYAGIFQNKEGKDHLYLVGMNFNSWYNLFKFPIKEDKIGTHRDSEVYAGMDKNIHDIVNDIKTNQQMVEEEK